MADIINVGNKQDKWALKVTELLNWLNENKQTILTAGDNITLTPLQDGSVRIDASGGGGGSSTLANLTDVDLSNPSNNQVLAYDASNQKWVNMNQSGGGASHTYSTTEQVVGTWIDNRPVYEQTFIYENSSGSSGGSSGATFDVWNLGNDKVIIPGGLQAVFVNLITNKMYPIPYAETSATNLYMDGGIVKLKVKNDDWGTNYKLHMVARYTKTTD